MLFAYTTVSLLRPFSRWLLIKAGSFQADWQMILVKLEFPIPVWNKELCSCPFNGQIPALPSDAEAQVPPAHVLFSVTLCSPFQCSGSCLHLWQLSWNILFWAEHFKVHTQECHGIGVYVFFFSSLCSGEVYVSIPDTLIRIGQNSFHMLSTPNFWQLKYELFQLRKQCN